MRVSNCKCDVCGIVKGEGNKWLLGWVSSHGYALGDWSDEFERQQFDKPTHHFCSESCALKYQALFLRRDGKPMLDLVA